MNNLSLGSVTVTSSENKQSWDRWANNLTFYKQAFYIRNIMREKVEMPFTTRRKKGRKKL